MFTNSLNSWAASTGSSIKILHCSSLEWRACPAVPPEEFFSRRNETHLIIVAMGKKENENDVCRRLSLAGYIEHLDFWRWEEFEESRMLSVWYLYAHNKVFITTACIVFSSACNLNCEKCLAFIPLVRERNLHFTKSAEKTKRDIDALFRWVDYTPWLGISGGETFMYPYLEEILIHIGENHCSKIGKRLELVTNGTIIQNDRICELVRTYDFNIYISDYSENVPETTQTLEKLIEKMNA